MHYKWYHKLSTYLWQIILIIAGLLFIVLSFFAKDNRWFTTFNGIGVSLLLSGGLGFFVSALFNKREEKLEIYEKWRITNIYSSRTIANQTIDAYQEKAKHQIDIIAFGLSSWRQSKEKLIDHMLNRGVKIRIITMDPYCGVLSMRDHAEGKSDGATKESILHLQQFFQQTPLRRSVEIRYHQDLPLDFYFRVDNHIFVGPYVYGKESQQMLTYEYEEGGEGYDYYFDYFDSLWNGKTIPPLKFVTPETSPQTKH